MAAAAKLKLDEAREEFRRISQVKEQEQRLLREYYEHNKDLKRHNKVLAKQASALKKEVAELKQKVEEQERFDSSSRDARKMYGDMIPGGITHQDVTLQYTNHFKDAFRNIPKDLPNAKKYEVWQMCADIIEESFKQNKELIITNIVESLEEALLDSKDTLDEDTNDLHRAFKMFVETMKETKQLEEIKHQMICQGVYDEATLNLAMDIITELDPDDYLYFIETGKKRNRSVQSQQCQSEIKPTKALKDEMVCAACKKHLKERENPTYHLGQYWHTMHSYCGICRRMVDEGFKFHQKTTYCSSCLCVKCEKPINDEVMATDNGNYHRQCLSCCHCDKLKRDMLIINEKFVCKSCSQRYYTIIN